MLLMWLGAKWVSFKTWWARLGAGEKAAYGSAIAGSAIGALAAIAVAIIPIISGNGPPSLTESPTNEALPPIPPTTTPPTVSLDPPTDSPTPEPTPAYGTALKFKIQGAGSTRGPRDVAFPESKKAQ